MTQRTERGKAPTREAMLAAAAAHGTTRKAAESLGISYGRLARFMTLHRAVAEHSAQAAPAPAVDPNAILQMMAAQMTMLTQMMGGSAAPVSAAPPPDAKPPAPKPEKPAKPEKPLAGGTLEHPSAKTIERYSNLTLCTVAQNNTHHHPVLRTLETIIRHRGHGQILCGRTIYNKNGYQNGTDDSDGIWYDEALEPYMCAQSTRIADDVVFCGELNILPTAADAINGFDSYTGMSSAIVPHTTQDLDTMPVMPGADNRYIWSSGTCTQRNYIEKRAGQVGAFNHVFGAILCEVDSAGRSFMRQLNADEDGVIQDLDTVYYPDGRVEEGVRTLVATVEPHAEMADAEVDAGVFGTGGILETLRPVEIHTNDSMHHLVGNHHNLADPYHCAALRTQGHVKVRENVQTTLKKLLLLRRHCEKLVVIESNHDLALRRWAREADGHRDPANAAYWHWLNWRIFDHIEQHGAEPHVFSMALRHETDLLDDGNTLFLTGNDSYVICPEHGGGIECGLHFDVGPNGGRGNIVSFSKLSRRTNGGHIHKARQKRGAAATPLMAKKQQGYNKGLSSWATGLLVTHRNSKRQHILMRGPFWRATQ